MPKQPEKCKEHILTANNILQQQKPQKVSNWGQLKKLNLLRFEKINAETRTTSSGKPVSHEWECVLNFFGKIFSYRSVRKSEAENLVAKQLVEHISSTSPN